MTDRGHSDSVGMNRPTLGSTFDFGFDVDRSWPGVDRTVALENDLTFRLDFNVKDSKIIQRKIDEVNTITNGNISYQFRPNISYVLNQRLNIKFYFERSINQPRVSNSFRRSSTSFGTQVRFSLAQ